MSKLSWFRIIVQLAGVVAFGLVTITAKPSTMREVARPATEGSCCASMAHHAPACPPESGMNGTSCCNLQVCLQLFLQTGELSLEPGFAEFRWANFDSAELIRNERPPVPPPRA